MKPTALLPMSPMRKAELPPLKTTVLLPSIKMQPESVKTLPMSPLIKDVKENKEEILQQVEKDLAKKSLPASKTSLPPLAVGKITVQTLPPLSKTSTFKGKLIKKTDLSTTPKELPSIPKADLPTLKMAQEGAKSALLAEPEAAFQSRQVEAPSAETSGLATIVKPAKLPSVKKRSKTPKIKIPKIAGTAVKPSPKKGKQVSIFKDDIVLPETTTVIPKIPITSPTKSVVVKQAVAETSEVMENIKKLDVTKLKAERVSKGKDAGYSVQELKAIAGSLNLTKSGNKKELVERIKTAILKVNPNAFDLE